MPDEECQKCGNKNQRVFKGKHKCTDDTKTRQGNEAQDFICHLCTMVHKNYKSLALHKIVKHGMTDEAANPAGLCRQCGTKNKSVFQYRHICNN